MKVDLAQTLAPSGLMAITTPPLEFFSSGDHHLMPDSVYQRAH